MKSRLIHIMASTILVPYLLMWLASCSVKEDRSVCPCNLEISFYEKVHLEGPVLMVGWSDEELFDVRIKAGEYPEKYSQNTPRTMVSFGAADGLVRCIKKGHSLIIPEGNECDSLYVYTDYIDCTGETAQTIVKLHKQFAVVHLAIANENYDTKDYTLMVNSQSCGIDMLTCEAIAGSFSCVPSLIGEKEYQFCASRQKDENMTLTVTHHSGEMVVFPMGEYIKTIGYDWKETDLKDIYITLDIARGRVGVGVAGWESIEDFEKSKVEL